MRVPPRKRQSQIDTTGVQETPQSLSVWRSTKTLVGMTVTAVVLTAAAVTLIFLGKTNHEGNLDHKWYYIPAAICIAIAIVVVLVVLVRRNAAPAPQRLPPDRSGFH